MLRIIPRQLLRRKADRHTGAAGVVITSEARDLLFTMRSVLTAVCIALVAPRVTNAQLGTVRFPNSGSAAAQADFLRGVAYLHSFVYDDAAESFRAAAAADPSFALPHWLEALSYRHPLWSEEDLAGARTALAKLGPDPATRLARAKDAKERGYGAAIEALFGDAPEVTRANAFADSMRHLLARYPNDLETTAFTSLAILGSSVFLPIEQRGARLAEAESLANRVYAAEPNHPGGAHYIIHAADDPNRAQRGLAAARAYAKIAPSAEHAQHMPSHIFVQLGMWDDAVQSNERAWKASRDEVAQRHHSGTALDFHDLNWLQYVYLQQGRYSAARALIDTARTVLAGAKLDGFDDPDARFALCDLAFRYASETGDWAVWRSSTANDPAINTPTVPPASASQRAKSFAGRCVYQRGIAAAMLGDTATATATIRAWRTSLDSLLPNSTNGAIASFRIAQLEGLVARARRNRARGITRLQAAATIEETLPSVGPPSALPTFELLGGASLADSQYTEAANAYERALKRVQNRSAALLGLARARAKLGDVSGSRDAYARLAANWHSPDASLPALAEVRAGAAGATRAPNVGEPLPKWTAGWLDIHHISTGRGNSTFIVLPDGTTLLVDAGAAGDGIPETDPHPDASRSPGAWIARYVKRHTPDTTALDYALITHFHPDHYGQIDAKSPLSAKGPYRSSGITEVGDAIPIRTLIDRGWPAYSFPAPFTDSTMANYRRFVDAQRARGMVVSPFIAGSGTQIRQLHDTVTHAGVEIRNIIGNGRVWTGTADGWRDLFQSPSGLPGQEDWPTENMCSLGFRLSYGRFRYFTGGDLPGVADPGFPSWHSVEPAIAALIGPVDVHTVGQHGSMGQETESFLRTLASKVLVIPSWAPSHPAPDVLKRIMNSRLQPVPRVVFATDMRESAKIVIGNRANQLAGPTGHIVVRVDPGGTRYRVYVLSNKDESDTILAIKGPFDSATK
jgi:tetratricopeptide (TPR) repeat protein